MLVFIVVHLARGFWRLERGLRRVPHQLHLLHAVGVSVRHVQRPAGQSVRALRLRLRHPRDQDHPGRLRHQGLPGQVDAAHQDGGPDALDEHGPDRGQGGSVHSHRLLLRQRLLLPLSQVRQERGQEARGFHPFLFIHLSFC